MRSKMVLGLMALMPACGQSSAPPTPRPEIKVRGEEQKQLAAASEQNRTIGLKRAIYDAGATCKRVVATGFVTEYKNMAMWQAGCVDGSGANRKDWAIFVAADGSIQVRPCGDLKGLGLPECKPLEKMAAEPKPAA